MTRTRDFIRLVITGLLILGAVGTGVASEASAKVIRVLQSKLTASDLRLPISGLVDKLDAIGDDSGLFEVRSAKRDKEADVIEMDVQAQPAAVELL